MEVIQSLLICLITAYKACKQFVILNNERRLPLIIYQIHRWRQSVVSITGNTLVTFGIKDKPCLVTVPKSRRNKFEYIVLTVFVLSITLYQILYGILMVFTQLSAQVDSATMIEASLNDYKLGNELYLRAYIHIHL